MMMGEIGSAERTRMECGGPRRVKENSGVWGKEKRGR